MSKKIEGQQTAEDVVEEIVDNSNLLLKKVKAFLPSLDKAAQFARVIIYWEVAKLILEFML
jgi:hypothetical protein